MYRLKYLWRFSVDVMAHFRAFRIRERSASSQRGQIHNLALAIDVTPQLQGSGGSAVGS